ncbi:MAG: hypothetical protein C0497_09190 [Gemmatimonas sp.]|nr:hypothetical protein [Gemmatimonas sp.]
MTETNQQLLAPAYFEARINDFLAMSDDEVLGQMTQRTQYPLTLEAISAWAAQLAIVRSSIDGIAGWIYLEYDVPRLGSRIDCVIVAGSAIIPIEFKVGARHHVREDYNQTWDYVLDLKNFQQASHQAPIFPILLCTDATVSEKLTPTAREILANIDAMELAIHQASAAAACTIADIVAIHARLMTAGPTAHVAGALRDEQNWIGGNDYNPCGADFVPPPPKHVKPLLDDLCRAISDDTLPPVAQAALVHAQFEAIHPFLDGNGRTGRALIHVVLKRRGLTTAYVPPISVALSVRRSSYIAGLTKFRGDSVVPWIRHFADAANTSAELARAYLGAVARQTAVWREMLARHAAPRADSAAWKIIGVLPAHPMITGPAAIAATGRARAAVYQALDQLQQAGILKPVSESKRNRVWEAVRMFDLLEGLEAGKAPSIA